MSTEPSLQILLVDDEEIVHQTMGDYLRELGHRVDDAFDGLDALKSIESRVYDLALVDVRMPNMDGFSWSAEAERLRPEMPVVFVTGHGDMDMAIRALRLGAKDFLTKPLKLPDLDAVLQRSIGARRDAPGRSAAIAGVPSANGVSGGLVGVSTAIAMVREHIRLAVEARCETILITGETGTGKEVTAREIHLQGGSPGAPFVAVSCASMPDSLVESELFGHVRGAFTGATMDRIGYFEAAEGGTIFLDEIGELSPSGQAKILRVLETRVLRRVGGSEEITVKVRVIAATNAPLEERIASGCFRRDLFYRLNAYPIHIIPLRERREDILPLAEHFLCGFAAPRGLPIEGFSPEARDKLLRYDFPGNARELRYAVERAAMVCRAQHILHEHIPLPEQHLFSTPLGAAEDHTRTRIMAVLEQARWNYRRAAKQLAIPYSTLRRKVQKLGIAK